MVNEVYRIGLCVFVIDLQGTNSRRVVNRWILEAAHLLALFASKSQKLNVHLDVVPRNLLLLRLV